VFEAMGLAPSDRVSLDGFEEVSKGGRKNATGRSPNRSPGRRDENHYGNLY